MNNMSKLLITGISGFVGRNLLSNLSNYNITGICRGSSSDIKISNYYDINIKLINSYNVFIHLAGKANGLNKNISGDDFFSANTSITMDLFDKFLQSDCKTFIYLSSIKAVCDKASSIVTESNKPNPNNAYGKSKLAAENYILNSNIPSSKNFYILRPTMIYGPGNKGNLSSLYNIVSMGFPWPLGKYKNQRVYCSIDNLIFVINSLIKNNIESGIYNVCDDEKISTNKLIRLIGESIDSKIMIFNIPKIIIKSISILGDLINSPLNSDSLSKLTESFITSNNKIKSAIGIYNMPIKSEESFIKTFKSFK